MKLSFLQQPLFGLSYYFVFCILRFAYRPGSSAAGVNCPRGVWLHWKAEALQSVGNDHRLRCAIPLHIAVEGFGDGSYGD